MTRTGRRATVATAAVVLTAALTGCAGIGIAGGSSASCAVTSIDLGESSLQPGGTVQLHVDWMWQTCEDTGGIPRPAEDVTVSITSSVDGREVVLGHPDPVGETFTVRGSFDLPEDLPVGDAVLAVASDGGDRTSAELPVTITATPAPATAPPEPPESEPGTDPSSPPVDGERR